MHLTSDLWPRATRLCVDQSKTAKYPSFSWPRKNNELSTNEKPAPLHSSKPPQRSDGAKAFRRPRLEATKTAIRHRAYVRPDSTRDLTGCEHLPKRQETLQ